MAARVVMATVLLTTACSTGLFHDAVFVAVVPGVATACPDDGTEFV